MIHAFTSYYSKAKVSPVLEENRDKLMSISQFNVSASIPKIELFAPSKKLLFLYKNNKISKVEYIREYKKQLDNLLKVYSINHLKSLIKNRVLLCYESPEKFCHRHILREWFLRKNVLLLEFKNPLRVGVIGSRNFNNYFLLKNFLLKFKKSLLEGQEMIIVSGAARGADSLAEKFALEFNIETNIYSADWNKYGKKAGFIRNEDIVKNSDILIAFWDQESKGTKNSLDLCRKYKKLVIVYDFVKKRYYIQKVFEYLDFNLNIRRRFRSKKFSESLN